MAFLPKPLHPRIFARFREVRRPPHYPTGGAKAPRASSPRPPPLASLSSWLPERLSSLHGASGPNPSRRDLGCIERCLPAAFLASDHLLWSCASEDLYLPTDTWQAPAAGAVFVGNALGRAFLAAGCIDGCAPSAKRSARGWAPGPAGVPRGCARALACGSFWQGTWASGLRRI